MKKIILSIFLIIFLLSGCQGGYDLESGNIDSTKINNITIKALKATAPPKSKYIDKEKDVDKVIEFINSIDKKKVEQEDINGWEFWIENKGIEKYSITFIGNKMKINKTWYKINANELKKLRELYNELDYKETPITS